ncbi:MAG TPA: hypothetical protein VEA37_15205, partial [Flavobacterium sp.]|nr:hypothetical protein [Flavobacterium sp.]
DEEKSTAQKILLNREAMLQTFLDSEQSVKNALGPKGNVAADVYFLKTCLVAAEILRRKLARTPEYVFMPDRNLDTPVNRYVLFDFSNGEDPANESMHYPTFRLPYAKFVVEYLRQLSS